MPKNSLLSIKYCKYRGVVGASPREPHFLICCNWKLSQPTLPAFDS